MGRDKYYEARMQGMAYALRIARESGVEGLEAEINMRGNWDVPIGITRENMLATANMVKEDIAYQLQSKILLIVRQVLHDKFGYGPKRMERFETEVQALCGCIIEKNVTYEDLEEMQRGDNVCK